MTVPDVTTATTVTSSWGQEVTDEINNSDHVFWTGDSNGTSGTPAGVMNLITLPFYQQGETQWYSTYTPGGLGGSAGRIVPDRAGWYLCCGHAAFNIAASAWARYVLYRNGTARAGDATYGISGTPEYLNWTFFLPMNGTTDYIEVGWQSKNGEELSDADLSVIWMRPL